MLNIVDGLVLVSGLYFLNKSLNFAELSDPNGIFFEISSKAEFHLARWRLRREGIPGRVPGAEPPAGLGGRSPLDIFEKYKCFSTSDVDTKQNYVNNNKHDYNLYNTLLINNYYVII